MPSKPAVSIIVPVYKVEKYIRRCLDSIIAQTFSDWECILVDDGSPDASGRICDEYASKESRFRVIHKKNGGVSSARNAGLDVARGEWICFCDSDDWEEKDFFDKALKLCSDSTDIVKSGYRIIGKKERKDVLPADSSPYEQVSNVHTSCHLIRSSYLSEHNIRFPENISLAEDWYFNYQLAIFRPKVAYLNEITYNYYQNENSVMHTLSRKNIEDEISIIKKATSQQIKNDELILLRTFDVRSKILYFMQDFALYRKTFPETFAEQFKRSSIRGKILQIVILLHLDFLAKRLLEFKSRISKKKVCKC